MQKFKNKKQSKQIMNPSEAFEKLEHYQKILKNYFDNLYKESGYQHPHFPTSGNSFETEMFDNCLDALLFLNGDEVKFIECHEVAMRMPINKGTLGFKEERIDHLDLRYAPDRIFVASTIKTLAYIISRENSEKNNC